jgi:hypothetical protein
MGTTPIYGFPYPDPSDLVANYPALGQQLAEDIETELSSAAGVLQVVRNTDSTARTTTSTSFTDVTGMTVTITPEKATSFILLIAVFQSRTTDTVGDAHYIISDSANNSLVGTFGFIDFGSTTGGTPISLFAYPAATNTSARTYKLRFKVAGAGTTASVVNDTLTGQMYAIEVAG